MLQCSHILFPVDFSDRCARAVPAVRAMANRVSSKLTLLHVLPPPRTWGESIPDASDYSPPIDMQQATQARLNTLEEFAASMFDGLSPALVVEIGDAAANITDYAERYGVGMIMMPTHGCGLFRRCLLGSVTAKVLHDTKCLVWTDIHAMGPRAAAEPIRNVVCAVGMGEGNVELIRRAGEFAALWDARLTLAHVVHSPESAPLGRYTAFRDRLLEQARNDLRVWMEQAGVDAEIWAGGGPVTETVRHAAELFDAGVVMIGRGHLPHTLGSLRTHAYGIIRDSPCPVIRI